MSILTEINRIKAAVTSIVQAIRGKGVTVPTTAKIGDLATLISNIPQLDTSDATATAGSILYGETAYVKGKKITGNIPTKTNANLTVDGNKVWTEAGYYAEDTYKAIPTATRAQTTIIVSADDANDKLTLTASNDQSAGYVYNSNQTATETVTLTASGATVTAKTSTKPVRSISKTVTDSNLVAANIKKGVSIFGVTGSYEGEGGGINVILPARTVTVTDNDYAGGIVVTALVNDGGKLVWKSTNVPTGGSATITYVWYTPIFLTATFTWFDVYDAEGDYMSNCPYKYDSANNVYAIHPQVDNGDNHKIECYL